MSDKKHYFDELKQELKDLPLKERLLQELSDHVDDLEQEQAKPLTHEKMSKIVGDSKYIRRAYYTILNPLRGLYFLTEGLFCGLLLLPLGIASFLSQGLMANLFYPSDLGGDQSLFTISSILLGFGLSLFLWFKAFSLAFRHWRKLSASTGYPLWLWIVLILLPTAIFRGGLFIAMLSIFLECPTCNEYPMSDLASIVSPVLATAGVMGLGAWLAWKKSKQPTKEKSIQWGKKILFVFAIYLMVYAVLRTGASYGLVAGFFESQNTLMVVFTPLFFFEYVMLLFGISLGLGVTNGVVVMSFLGSVFFFLILQAFVDVFKNKRIAWLRVSVAVWALSLLMVNPQEYIPKVEWQKPVWPISENFEQQQHGIFYGLLKFANQDEGRLYRYNVDRSGEEFLVTQNEEVVFSIDPTKPNQEEYEEKAYSAEALPDFKESPLVLPENLKCFSKHSDFEGLVPADFYACNTLTWKNESIFTMEYWTTITDFAFSEDEKWLMLVIQTGAYDPEHVYLIEL